MQEEHLIQCPVCEKTFIMILENNGDVGYEFMAMECYCQECYNEMKKEEDQL